MVAFIVLLAVFGCVRGLLWLISTGIVKAVEVGQQVVDQVKQEFKPKD